MNSKQLIKLLKESGFSEIRQNGSHKTFKNSVGKMVVVPDHGSKDLKAGTLNSILKDAGLK
jgi:mRNA interferase HicA